MNSVDLPLALYVHIPWCERKCPYCDFNSHPIRQPIPEAAYVTALLADLAWEWQRLPWPRPVHSLFMGGGTPSTFSPPAIQQLLNGIRRQVPCQPNLEITLEANPGTVDYAKFSGFHSSGITRLSLGIQSFNAGHLQQLGRIHDPQQAHQAIVLAQQAGFSRLNLDLMYGLPQQTPEQAVTDIEQAIAHQPQHISLYQLTLEPNTAFYRHPPTLPTDDSIWESQHRCQQLLAHAGYQQYEVSAYAQPGYACQHNLNYWQFGDYIGIGAGAHSKLTHPSGIIRHSKHKSPGAFMQRAGTQAALATEETVTPDQLPLEFLMNALRLPDGFQPELFTQRTGLTQAALRQILQPALARNWIDWQPQQIKTTAQGWHYLDTVLQLFV